MMMMTMMMTTTTTTTMMMMMMMITLDVLYVYDLLYIRILHTPLVYTFSCQGEVSTADKVTNMDLVSFAFIPNKHRA